MDSIDMRGTPEGPFRLGRHMQPGPEWVWWDGTAFSCASRWRWLCARRGKRRDRS